MTNEDRRLSKDLFLSLVTKQRIFLKMRVREESIDISPAKDAAMCPR